MKSKNNLLIISILALTCLASSAGMAQEKSKYKTITTGRNGVQNVYGLVSPLDQEGKNFCILNADGLIEVKLAVDAKIGLLFRERDIAKMLETRKIKLASVGQEHALPEKLYVEVRFPNWRSAQHTLKSGTFRDGIIHADPLPDHLPTENELWLSGELTALEKGHITPGKVVTVSGQTFKGSTEGYNHSEQIVGLFDHTAIKPFCNQASLYGKFKGDVFYASGVMLRPIGKDPESINPADAK